MMNYKNVYYSDKQYVSSNVEFSSLIRGDTILVHYNDEVYGGEILNVSSQIPTIITLQCKNETITLELDLTSTRFGMYLLVEMDSYPILRFYCNRMG